MQERYDVFEYPASRVATFDVGKIGGRKHHIAGLVEIDVTDVRRSLSEKIRAGENVSFTAFLVKCLGATVGENRYIHALNTRGRKQIVFESVDISMPIEKEVNGTKVPLACVIRHVNEKTVEQIFLEIRDLKAKKIDSEKDYVLGKQSNANGFFFNMPQALRMIVWNVLLGNPFLRKRTMGTVMLTNVGMAGNISGWIIPKSMHNLCVGIGSINKKPWIVSGEIMIREIMHVTILADHDAVDGAPVARFTSNLVANLENAKWLEKADSLAN